MIELDEDTRDALAETFNMALGEASAQFAELVGEEIELSVPVVDLVPRENLVARLVDSDGLGPRTALCRIAQTFRSRQADLDTQAVLIFTEQGSLEIVRRLLGDAHAEVEGLNEIEQDALGEIGNIVINSCMNSLAHIFDREMVGTLPDVRTGMAGDLFGRAESAGHSATLFARISMRMSSRRISGHVLFIMDLRSLQIGVRQIRQFFGLPLVNA